MFLTFELDAYVCIQQQSFFCVYLMLSSNNIETLCLDIMNANSAKPFKMPNAIEVYILLCDNHGHKLMHE